MTNCTRKLKKQKKKKRTLKIEDKKKKKKQSKGRHSITKLKNDQSQKASLYLFKYSNTNCGRKKTFREYDENVVLANDS